MAPSGNVSVSEEKCLACNKSILTSKMVKCGLCHKSCHLNCIVPKLPDEIKEVMRINKLVTFTCPKCQVTLSKHKGKLNDEFIDFADKNIQMNEVKSKQINDMQREISDLAKQLQKAKQEKNAINDQINVRGKRPRGSEEDDSANMIAVVGIVKQLIDQSNKSMEAMIKQSEERNIAQINLLRSSLAAFEDKIGNFCNIQPISGISGNQPSKDVGTPAPPLKKIESQPFTEIKMGINKLGSSLKMILDASDKQKYDEILLPQYRNDTVIRKFNLIGVAENRNEFILTFKN